MPPYVCLFCLAPDGSKDIFSDNYCDGRKEVYSDMIWNTFNITMPQHLHSCRICEQCVSELRRAAEFKMKVIKSQYLSEKHLKVDNECTDDFDDTISVDFDEGPQAAEGHTGHVFVIKLNSKPNLYVDNEMASVADDAVSLRLNEMKSLPSPTFDEGEHTDDQNFQQNLKQPESQNHKDVKENSLNLIFNSNLCLFKSLKTKFGCFICNEAFLNINNLREHTKLHANAELIRAKFNRLRGLSYQNADISNLECTICGQVCLDLTDLKNT